MKFLKLFFVRISGQKKIMNDIIEVWDIFFKCLNLNLLVGCGLRKLLIFIDLSLEFLVKF